MEAQGYQLSSNIIWQDNEDAERMAKNGKMSCSRKSRHIAIKFFWIHDRVKQGQIEVKHCPTDVMLADFFTKVLQGKRFDIFRRVIMGWDHISILNEHYKGLISERVSLKERVGDNGKINVTISDEAVKKISWSDIVQNRNHADHAVDKAYPKTGVEK